MIKQYFNIYKEKIKEYGEKTAVLFQVGSFYEIYQIDNGNDSKDVDDDKVDNKIGNAYVLSKILNMKYANKLGDVSKNSTAYPNFIGFNVSILNKYLSILLENDYTVVLVNQLESSEDKKGKLVKRGITAVYSSSLQPPDFEYNSTNVLLSIYVESNPKEKEINYSIISINNSTNMIEILDQKIKYASLKLDVSILDNVLNTFFPKEVVIRIKSDDKTFCDLYNYFKQYFQFSIKIEKVKEEIKEYTKFEYQNEYFKKVYKHINFGLIQPIEYLGLTDKKTSIINFMYIIDFIGKHDLTYISNLNIPIIIKENNNLILELNTLYQLNIHGDSNASNKNKSVFDIIDFTSTLIGRRYLKSLLCKPLKDPVIIDWRYKLTESLENNINESKIKSVLNELVDFERLHRKMGLSCLHPYEFVKLKDTYNNLIKIIDYLRKTEQNDPLFHVVPNEDIINSLKEYINKSNHLFNYTIMENFDLNTKNESASNYFNSGVINNLDVIQSKIDSYEKEREKLRISYDEKINKENCNSPMIKLVYTENDGYSFTCTKIRFANLLTKIKNGSLLKTKTTNSTTKFYPDELISLSNKIICNKELLNRQIKLHYLEFLSNSYNEYHHLFGVLKEFVEIIDITFSNIICKNKYNYCRPMICEGDENLNKQSSFLRAKEMRHPLIERICNTEYIPNDISLTSEKNGSLLYGVNSSGKSSLLRAIGVNTILAQCGLYVACKEFVYFPFDKIVSQVDLTDNLFSGKSSFVNEMIGLKKILTCSNENTLVLCDEMCKGTEPNSSISLVTSTILKLIKDNTKFFFTSHLHEISKLKEIVNCQNLSIHHLSVDIINDDIIFRRKLKIGCGSDLYGLEVSGNILCDPIFMDIAFSIRNKLTNNKTSILGLKKSVYNKKKVLSNCEICDNTQFLETHHCNFQKDADDNGFIKNKSFHKNSVFNLICLCKKCHLKVTLNKIIINGYITSTKGKYLDYIIKENT